MAADRVRLGFSPREVRGRTALIATLTSVFLALSCGHDKPPDECLGQPTFRVTITSELGSLPAGTEIEVEYGGTNSETYRVGGSDVPKVVFCQRVPGTSDAEAGAGGEATGLESLDCALWTEGPATVIARAPGYATTVHPLKRKERLCTVTDAIDLDVGDGGA